MPQVLSSLTSWFPKVQVLRIVLVVRFTGLIVQIVKGNDRSHQAQRLLLVNKTCSNLTRLALCIDNFSGLRVSCLRTRIPDQQLTHGERHDTMRW